MSAGPTTTAARPVEDPRAGTSTPVGVVPISPVP